MGCVGVDSVDKEYLFNCVWMALLHVLVRAGGEHGSVMGDEHVVQPGSELMTRNRTGRWTGKIAMLIL